MDSRIERLAELLVNYSCQIKPGEKVQINYKGNETQPLVRACIKEVYKAGGIPFTFYTDPQVLRELLLQATPDQIRFMAETDKKVMDSMQAYIGISGPENVNELADVPADRMEMYAKLYSHPVHMDIRVPKTKWVVLRYPNAAMAQLSGTSVEAFEEFYYNVCCLDYAKMRKSMQPLMDLMDRTDRVHMTGPGTDLSFSIKDIPSVACAGDRNIPDGEVYTAPVRNSVNGTISYNTPSIEQGFTFENISLTFKDGKIIKATANDTARINRIFDVDEGARYIGEFSFGINPYVMNPMKDILFDEKINGSIHFTPGNCYDEAPNGNKSALHWDLVWIQRSDCGGGEVWFDDVLIRKDGRFLLPELACLNPENLK